MGLIEETKNRFGIVEDSPIQIITNVRVGTMFVWELFGQNFVNVPQGPRSIKPYHTHLTITLAKKHGWYNALKGTEKPTIYVLRDGRDQLVSAYKRAKLKGKIGGDFRDYIRGECEVLKSYTEYKEMAKKIRTDPVNLWVEHTDWIQEDWVDVYKFEDIRNDQTGFVQYLVDKYGLELKHPEIQMVNKLVGKDPNKGIAGGWKDYFDKDDLDYFWNIAGDKMKELGYE